MKIIPLFVLVACMAWQSCLAQDESESRSVPARGLLKRNPLSRTTTTTTTTPSPLEEQESEYEDSDALYSDQEVPVSPETPTTTEGKKKLVAGGVRPFRSNTDLLEALKKKRAQAAQAKLEGHTGEKANSNSGQETPTEVKGNISYTKKRPQTKEPASQNEDFPPPTSKPAGYRGRFTRPPAFRRAVPETDVEQDKDNSSTNVRSGRTFRRGGN